MDIHHHESRDAVLLHLGHFLIQLVVLPAVPGCIFAVVSLTEELSKLQRDQIVLQQLLYKCNNDKNVFPRCTAVTLGAWVTFKALDWPVDLPASQLVGHSISLETVACMEAGLGIFSTVVVTLEKLLINLRIWFSQ